MESIPMTWLTARTAGVLAHVSSLPGDYGIGNLGPGARTFVDFLAQCGVRHWQICPIGPTGYGDSPYQLFSGRAGNPYFIDLGELSALGLIEPGELAGLKKFPSDRVDYGALYANFWNVLRQAAERFFQLGADGLPDFGSLDEFRRSHASWLEPFADFMALKSFFAGQPWTLWPEKYRQWSPALHAGLDG